MVEHVGFYVELETAAFLTVQSSRDSAFRWSALNQRPGIDNIRHAVLRAQGKLFSTKHPSKRSRRIIQLFRHTEYLLLDIIFLLFFKLRDILFDALRL